VCDCHTPADARNRPIAALEFSTSAPSGIPYYDADLFIEVMRTGFVKARKIHDAMPWQIYGQQTDDDLRAIFAFLQSIPPVPHRLTCIFCRTNRNEGQQASRLMHEATRTAVTLQVGQRRARATQSRFGGCSRPC
jgi:hypothetical protein